MEVILGSFALEIFGPIVVAAVISTLLARAAGGQRADLRRARLRPGEPAGRSSPTLGLGVVGALASLAFVARRARRRRGSSSAPRRSCRRARKPVLGMALLGAARARRARRCWAAASSRSPWRSHGELPPGGCLLLLPLAKLAGDGAHRRQRRRGRAVHAVALLRRHGRRRLRLRSARALSVRSPPLRAPTPRSAWPRSPPAPATRRFSDPHPLRVHRQLRADPAADGGVDRLEPARPAPLPVLDLHRAAAAARRRALLADGGGGARRPRVDDLVRPDPDDAPSRATPTARWSSASSSTRRQRLFVVDADRRAARRGLAPRHQARAARGSEALPRGGARPDGAGRAHGCATSDRLHRAAELFARSDFERLPVRRRRWPQVPRRPRQARPARGLRPGGARPAGAALDLRRRAIRPSRRGARVDLPPDFAVALGALSRPSGRPDARRVRTPPAPRRPRDRDQAAAAPRRPEWIVPDAGTVLRAGDELVVLGPTGGRRPGRRPARGGGPPRPARPG